ncbi:unnamed protein product, partial [Rotaria sp. Silwood1]
MKHQFYVTVNPNHRFANVDQSKPIVYHLYERVELKRNQLIHENDEKC